MFCLFFLQSFGARFCTILGVLFKLAPSGSGEMLASGPKFQKGVLHLTENRHASDKLCSGMSHRDAGCEFSHRINRVY